MDMKEFKRELLRHHGALQPSETVIAETAFDIMSGANGHDEPVSGLKWMGLSCAVRGGDYEYKGTCLLSFPKGIGGPLRYIVMDQNRRLFIHNADQIKIGV